MKNKTTEYILGGIENMSDLRVICPSCYTEHSQDRNRILSKFGKYWIEMSSDCGWDLLCGHCEFSLDQRGEL